MLSHENRIIACVFKYAGYDATSQSTGPPSSVGNYLIFKLEIVVQSKWPGTKNKINDQKEKYQRR